jgi:hypothetical protein
LPREVYDLSDLISKRGYRERVGDPFALLAKRLADGDCLRTAGARRALERPLSLALFLNISICGAVVILRARRKEFADLLRVVLLVLGLILSPLH